MVAGDRESAWSLVLVGSARLPKSLGYHDDHVLLVELCVDASTRRVADVGTTIQLAGYIALLRTVLIGRELDEISSAASELSEKLRGPLLRPTIAALASAVSHGATNVSK